MRFSSVTETDRLRLRRPDWRDLDVLYRLHADPAVWEHSPHSRHTEPATTEAWLRVWLAHWEAHGFGYWVAEHDGDVVGAGGLMLLPGWDDGRDALNVYYRFAPRAWGRGLASELVAAAVELAPPLLLVARVDPSNLPSARVALRNGFDRRPDLDRDGLEVYARANASGTRRAQ